ncbi:MAG TPA: acyltransferase family protein [Acidimicrobiales bacterium]|nr:acyltransferase family protein [Acidimicrobiales bacterium]
MAASGGRVGTRHVTGLDGIRALAVLAVMGVHQQFGWLPGGFYGVDAFFVLSGFLITTLLVTELGGTGTIRLGAFWARRARRLLPALLLMVLVVAIVAAVDPTLIGAPSLPGAVATLFYSANWYFVARHVDYFAVFAQPSPLLHTWSLAIEEQFYLVWPLVVLAVLTVGRRRGSRPARHRAGAASPPAAAAGPALANPLAPTDPLTPDDLLAGRLSDPAGNGAADDWAAQAALRRRLRWLLLLAGAGAVTSALLMALLAPTGGDPSRAYYGTDTRAQAILVGAALAVLLALRGAPKGRPARSVIGWAAVGGAAGTVALWRYVPETSGLAFRGGFLLAALAAGAVLVQVVLAPRGLMARFLSLPPLAALGKISYGVYLWYWPVLLALSEQRTHLEAYLLFGVRLAVTVALATVSYLLVEQPIRQRRVPGAVLALAAPAGLAVALGVTAIAGALPATTAGPLPVAAALPPGSHPTKVLVVGDSAAGSLGVGLGQLAPRYDVQLMNDGDPGCSLSMDQMVKTLWYTLPPSPPCRTGDPRALLSRWRTIVDHYNPDVVVYLARADLLDQQVDGRWENIGQPRFDDYLRQRLQAAVGVLGARGAAVVLMTSPYYETQDTPNTPWPEDRPARVVDDDRILRQVVRSSTPVGRAGSAGAGTEADVTVFDLGGLVTPGGHFSTSVDGTTLRCTDGVHFTAAGGRFVARHLFPRLVALGRTHHQASPGGHWPGTPPPTTPAWWSTLPCR